MWHTDRHRDGIEDDMTKPVSDQTLIATIKDTISGIDKSSVAEMLVV